MQNCRSAGLPLTAIRRFRANATNQHVGRDTLQIIVLKLEQPLRVLNGSGALHGRHHPVFSPPEGTGQLSLKQRFCHRARLGNIRGAVHMKEAQFGIADVEVGPVDHLLVVELPMGTCLGNAPVCEAFSQRLSVLGQSWPGLEATFFGKLHGIPLSRAASKALLFQFLKFRGGQRFEKTVFNLPRSQYSGLTRLARLFINVRRLWKRGEVGFRATVAQDSHTARLTHTVT